MANENWCDPAQAYTEEQLAGIAGVEVIRRNARMIIIRVSKPGEPPSEFMISQVDLIKDGGSEERMKAVCDSVIAEVLSALSA